MAVEVNDVSLYTMQYINAIPHARPYVKVHEVLIISYMNVRTRHARIVVGRPQKLETGKAGRRHAFANGRVRMTRKQGMGMDVTSKRRGRHGVGAILAMVWLHWR
jgi:hypothetical protein